MRLDPNSILHHKQITGKKKRRKNKKPGRRVEVGDSFEIPHGLKLEECSWKLSALEAEGISHIRRLFEGKKTHLTESLNSDILVYIA